MQVGPGAPVDMDAVDAMAATATENGDKAEQGWSNLQQGFLNSGSRTASFGQGAIEGRGYQAIEGGLGTALEAAL